MASHSEIMTLSDSNFELLAKYNQGMNLSIYSVCSKLNPPDLAKNQGAFFGSIINTLNHILVGDIIWLQRFANHSDKFTTLDYARKLETPTALDTILYSDFFELKEKREKTDHVIIRFISEVTDMDLSIPFSYTNMKGNAFTKNFGHILLHFFNHQTHHRGQISTLLHQQGVDMGLTDLLGYIPNFE